MKLAVRRTSAAVAAVATAGVSSLFVGVAPAYAAPSEACGPTGDLVGPGVCEQVFTSAGSFTPTAQMTTLEVLLVGAGGNGTNQNASATTGYAAGGGGEVRLVDFSGTTDPIAVVVSTPGVQGSVSDGITTETVDFGLNGTVDNAPGATATGGASGSGQAGSSVPADDDPATPSYGAGGGAGTAASGANGGAGVIVDSIAAGGSLFDGDTRCYGGGGAVAVTGVTGVAGCGGGYATSAGGSMVAPVANSGGGSGALTSAASTGASGVVIMRWPAATITLSFEENGHGTAPASQSFPAGSTATKPADPTADSYQFDGWYTDPQLTTLADFSAPVTASTTYYAKWTAILAATGSEPNLAYLAAGATALLAGVGMTLVARRRRPNAG